MCKSPAQGVPCVRRSPVQLLLQLVPREAGEGFDLHRLDSVPEPRGALHGCSEAGVGPRFWRWQRANGFSRCAGDTALPPLPVPNLPGPLGRDCLCLAVIVLLKPLGLGEHARG